MRALAVATIVLLGALAGCVAEPAAPASAPASAAATLFAWQGKTLRAEGNGLDAAAPLAACLAGACASPPVTCGASNCERVPFTLPASKEGPQDLVVRVRWPTSGSLWLRFDVEDAAGRIVARGDPIVLDHAGAAARLEDAPPGSYVAVVMIATGEGPYEGDVRLEPRPPREGELLPDLVTLPPTDLRIAPPPSTQVGSLGVGPGAPGALVAEALGAKGCAPDEAAAGARRCLRFSNLVGNVGPGPLEIRLSLASGATSAAGGRFVQRLHSADGTHRDVPAGAAEFHALHAHWHNAAANAYAVHAYDPDTGARGAPVAEGHKTGICFADVGLVWEGAPFVLPARNQGVPCINPAPEKEWAMGLTPGWYDAYDWVLSDQHVEIGGLPDGAYLLCSATNAAGLLRETDASNNEACTPFLLRGDEVTELAPKPYYAWPG